MARETRDRHVVNQSSIIQSGPISMSPQSWWSYKRKKIPATSYTQHKHNTQSFNTPALIPRRRKKSAGTAHTAIRRHPHDQSQANPQKHEKKPNPQKDPEKPKEEKISAAISSDSTFSSRRDGEEWVPTRPGREGIDKAEGQWGYFEGGSEIFMCELGGYGLG